MKDREGRKKEDENGRTKECNECVPDADCGYGRSEEGEREDGSKITEKVLLLISSMETTK